MPEYRFISTWRIPAPIDDVWDVVADSLGWPEWWPAVTRVEELKQGEASGAGNVRRYTFKGALPYALSFEMEAAASWKPYSLRGSAIGQLEGEGRWYFDAVSPNETVVRYEWDVETNRRWMNLLAPLLRPAFVWNHDYIMDVGERGLKRRLAATRRETPEPRG